MLSILLCRYSLLVHMFGCLHVTVLQQNIQKEQDLETAATEAKPLSSSTADAPASISQPASATANEEEVDIDLADPDVKKAAVFIQSSFKGFKQRKISAGFVKVDFYLPYKHYFVYLFVLIHQVYLCMLACLSADGPYL